MNSSQHLYRMKVEINASSRENSWPHSKRDVLADHQEQPFFFFCLSFRFSEFCLSVLSCFHLFLPEVPVGGEVDGMNILAWWCLPSSLVWPCRSWALRESCSSASSAPSVMHPSAGLLDHVGKWWKEEHLLLQTRWPRFKFSISYSLAVWLWARDFLCACFFIYKMGTVLYSMGAKTDPRTFLILLEDNKKTAELWTISGFEISTSSNVHLWINDQKWCLLDRVIMKMKWVTEA